MLRWWEAGGGRVVVGWFDFAAEAVPSCEKQTGRYCEKFLYRAEGSESKYSKSSEVTTPRSTRVSVRWAVLPYHNMVPSMYNDHRTKSTKELTITLSPITLAVHTHRARRVLCKAVGMCLHRVCKSLMYSARSLHPPHSKPAPPVGGAGSGYLGTHMQSLMAAGRLA